MAEIADRYRGVAAAFTDRVRAVPDDGWSSPAPCEGWVARDVVRHLVSWVPGFFESRGAPGLPTGDVDVDPVGAWVALDAAIQIRLDGGDGDFGDAVGQFVLPDVLVHTWDLARATGLDETLDAAECQALFEGMEPMDAAIRGEHFGPRVPVPDDADVQTKLLAFTGRTP
jgi:uncharacterized protein (TIGR03083 family)